MAPWIVVVATGGVVLIGLFLLALGITALGRPEVAARFLGGFATSAATHVLELGIRVLAGASLVVMAPRMAAASFVAGFGWVLIGTSLVLALLPWRLHQRFAAWSVPQAVPYLPLIGVVSLGGGAALFAALLMPRVAG